MDSVQPGAPEVAATVLETADESDAREFGTKLPLECNVLVDPNEANSDENRVAEIAEAASTSTPSRKRKLSTSKNEANEAIREEKLKNLLEVIKRAAQLQQDISRTVTELSFGNRNQCEGLQNEPIESSGVASRSTRPRLETRSQRKSKEAEKAVLRKTPLGLMVPDEQPLLLEGAALREHQLHGLKWLKAMDINVVNGILGDEMGLGKTLQVIAMICFLIEKGFEGPYVILAPLSIVPVWIDQFKTFAPKVPTLSYTGNEAERRLLFPKIEKRHTIIGKIKSTPIVVCAQHLLIRDPFLRTITWRYMVVDEGHFLNNPETQVHKVLLTWKTHSRCILTGTPLQNNTHDLWSLMSFLMPTLFGKLDSFDTFFRSKEFASRDKDTEQRLLEMEKETNLASHFREVLTPFLLRRLKSEVDLNIPKKTELVLTCEMTEEQAHLYDVSLNPARYPEPKEMLEDENGKRVRRSCVITTQSYVEPSEEDVDKSDVLTPKTGKENHYLFGNSSKRDLPTSSSRKADTPENLQRLAESQQMMTLRHIANHPRLLLRNTVYTPFSEEMVQRSSKLMLLDSMLRILKKKNHKVLIFSFFVMVLDLIDELLEARGYKFCRIDGSCDLETRKEQINDFTSHDDFFAFIMTTRTGGLGLNLVAADTVIFFDNDWNPHIDLQAEARCHRIGQTKPVAVYRLAVNDTIDIAMLMRAEGKQKLSTLLLTENSCYSNKLLTSTTKYTLKMFKKLLQAKSQPLVEPKNGIRYTDEELEELLDRSKMMGKECSGLQ